MRTLKITRAELGVLTDILNIDADDIRTDYSGRGMDGATCLGIVLDGSVNPIRLGVALVEMLATDFGDADAVDSALASAAVMAGRACTDSMGLGTIVYFPGVTVEG